MSQSIQPFINQVSSHQDLSVSDAFECLKLILDGTIETNDIVILLDKLQEKGESVSEIVGFAQAMLEFCIPLTLSKPAADLCGTGGSNKERFNISTASAFVCASYGVPIAKHGNYGSAKPNGSFNFLEALGVNFNHSPDQLASIFNQTGLCFLFARLFHPAVKHVAQARQQLGKRSIFNLLGPLCNPSSIQAQVVGTTSLETGRKLAQAAQELGRSRTLILIGTDGLDEASISHPTIILDTKHDIIHKSEFDPSSLNIPSTHYTFGDTQERAAQLIDCFQSPQNHPGLYHHIALNAGCTLFAANQCTSIKDGYFEALQHIESCNVYDFIQRFINISK